MVSAVFHSPSDASDALRADKASVATPSSNPMTSSTPTLLSNRSAPLSTGVRWR